MYAVGGSQDVSQDRGSQDVSQDRSRANGFADAFADAVERDAVPILQQLWKNLGDIDLRMRRLAAAKPAAAPAAAPALATRHRFVFKEGPQHPDYDIFEELKQAECTKFGESDLVFLHGKFFLESWAAGTQYITKIKVLGRYGGDFCRVSLALRDDKNLLDDVTKLGFMTASQYKRLCIFVVSRSLRDDLLDAGIGP
jgi:hypothetical protein